MASVNPMDIETRYQMFLESVSVDNDVELPERLQKYLRLWFYGGCAHMFDMLTTGVGSMKNRDKAEKVMLYLRDQMEEYWKKETAKENSNQ